MLGGNDSLLEGQFSERKDFGYPPFTRVIELTIKDTNIQRLEHLSRTLAEELRTAQISVSGPYAPAVDRISNTYIRHIRLTLKRDARLKANKEKVAKVLSSKVYQGRVSINVDPA